MTALFIAAVYLTITVATARMVWHRLTKGGDFEADDSEDRIFGGILGLIVGAFWPITLPGLVLVNIITAPRKGDTQ